MNKRGLAAQDMLQNQMEKLDDAKRVGYEAEHIAGDIKVNLHGQNDKLMKIHSNVH
jgi:hypothetical protein